MDECLRSLFRYREMGGGTEAFPDLGRHCQRSDCNQLDFLPFKCDGCHQVFCLEHRTYKSHECSRSEPNSRKVVVCEICSTSIETTGLDEKEEKAMLEKHEKTGECDPSRKKKPVCPVRRCKQPLTFSNTNTCKTCQLSFCLRHRFPGDHSCYQRLKALPKPEAKGRWSDKFLAALGARSGNDCAKNGVPPASTSGANHPVKAC